MSTMGEMADRIADDLNRTDLSTQIQKAINRAIEFYSKEPFWFTETVASFTLSQGAVAYTANSPAAFPTDIERIHYVEATISGSDNTLEEWPIGKIQQLNSNDSQGEPLAYAWWQNKIWLYPVPSAARVVNVYYSKNYAAMTSTASSNDWTSYAEDLIEARARWWIYSRIIKDVNSAVSAKQEETEALTSIRGQNENKTANLNIEPTCF